MENAPLSTRAWLIPYDLCVGDTISCLVSCVKAVVVAFNQENARDCTILNFAKVRLQLYLGHEVPGEGGEVQGPQLGRGAAQVLVAAVHVHALPVHHRRVPAPPLRRHHAAGRAVLLPAVILATSSLLLSSSLSS